MEQRLKESPSRYYPNWGFIPYTVTKPKLYFGCWEVLADRSLLYWSPERLCQCLTNTEVGALSQTIGLCTGSPMEELAKGLKDLNGFAAI